MNNMMINTGNSPLTLENLNARLKSLIGKCVTVTPIGAWSTALCYDNFQWNMGEDRNGNEYYSLGDYDFEEKPNIYVDVDRIESIETELADGLDNGVHIYLWDDNGDCISIEG